MGPRSEAMRSPQGRSLAEVHESVAVPRRSFWRRLLAFSGPAYLVSVGYMDPGNWATDIAAGSRFGYALLWVLLMSNGMAVLLQSLSARLGIVTGMDLAQACRSLFSPRVAMVLWILTEVGIAATDLAEILGSAIGLHLLFGVSILTGVLITAFDTFLLLLLHSRGVRWMEAFIITLITTIGVCLGIEVFFSHPSFVPIARGFVPEFPGEGALYLAIGILGATVMPHNLYLQSALVQSRRFRHTPAGTRSGLRFNLIDSVVALNGAFFVNAALLVMAAATFHRAGIFDVSEIQHAHRLLEPLLGARVAPLAFAVALIAAGQSSAITGTLAGQVVMEGFVQIRLRPVVRRLLTRSLALVPAVATILIAGEAETGDLLVLSQVILSLQLSFAVIPLVHLVSDRGWMGRYAIGWRLQSLAWTVAAIIAALNLRLAWEEILGWLRAADRWAWLLAVTVVPLSLVLAAFLVYVAVQPIVARRRGLPTGPPPGVHGPSQVPELENRRLPRKIAVAVDFSRADKAVLSYALTLARSAGRGARVVLLHVVESSAARLIGEDLRDRETLSDRQRLELYAGELDELGVDATWDLGYGDPAEELATLADRHGVDLMILGSHGHRIVGDLLHGTSVERLRHRVQVPVLVVPAGD